MSLLLVAVAAATAVFVLVVIKDHRTEVHAYTMESSDAKLMPCDLEDPQCPASSLDTSDLQLVHAWPEARPGMAVLERVCAAWLRENVEQPPEPPEPPYDPNAHQSKLGVRHANIYPTRVAEGPDGRVYVSDPRVGSVFIYDATLHVTAELGSLASPLGVAVAPDGAIYIGCRGTKSVEVYSSQGDKLGTIGAGAIQMPNDLALDRDGKLYVADSKSNLVRVYSSTGASLGDLGFDSNEGDMLFPSSVAVAYRTDAGLGVEVGELYVADQGHSRIRVYDLSGNLLRAFGAQTPAFFGNWKGKFARLQSLAVDALGQVHAADCYMNKVQVLDALTGTYVSSYGAFGTGQGQLNVPLDILITQNGQVVVANNGNRRVEVISAAP